MPGIISTCNIQHVHAAEVPQYFKSNRLYITTMKLPNKGHTLSFTGRLSEVKNVLAQQHLGL